ncbi:MAG: GTPase ObgE [Mycoplasmatales bacterium]
MFIDRVQIEVSAGSGGNGIIAFRREKFVAQGGPFGGSGGKGGNVIFEVDLGLKTLLDFRYNKKYHAKNGENGKSKAQHGKNAEDLILKVPPGTMIYNDDTDELLFDLTQKDQREMIAKGGRGGRGNVELARAGKHSLEISENGEPGITLNVRLELKLISDVGLVGLPSVGKSSLISVISKSKPKIAAYHFTTLVPNLGVTKAQDGRSFVVADLPGLIQGASEGKGLGLQFLRHIERTKVILHVVDMGSFEGRNPIEDFQTINEELKNHQMNLEHKKMIVVANKMDLPQAHENLQKFQKEFPNYQVFPISTVTRSGIEELLLYTADMVDKYEQEKDLIIEQPTYKVYEFKKEIDFEINKLEDNIYSVTGPSIQKLLAMTNFSTYDNIRRFSNKIKNMGVDDALREAGVQAGDLIKVEEFEFEFED